MDNHKIVIFDDDVQICKPLSVVNNRIEYFLKTKRKECDDRNTRLYCNSTFEDDLGSSRTCSTIENKRHKTSECFVKSTRVHNDSGPCNIEIDSASGNNCTLSSNTNSVKQDVHERISNLEKCLNIKCDNNMTIYKKLKSIENHVLDLQTKLFNNDANHLPNICTNDQYVEIINRNLKIGDITEESTNITENNLKNEHNNSCSFSTSNAIPKKSKYTVEDIKQLIINIQNKD